MPNQDSKSAPLSVLYQDEVMVVIDKPPGLMVHRSELSRGVREFALQQVRDMVGCHVYTVHRIDRPTSGVLVFALTASTAKALSGQFARREVTKSYRAVVRGFMDHHGQIQRPLEREPGAEPKAAQTHWERLSMGEIHQSVGRYETARYSILDLRPITGRRHQLRRHCAHIRHPIIGDVNYGDRHHNRFFREEMGIGRLLLHAQRLELMHPVLETPLLVEAPIPAVFATVAERLVALE